jgi:hypothetical protein
MSRIRTIASVFASALLVSFLVTRPALADAHTEAVAKDALQKATTDYSAMNYAGAAARLTKAVQACGANHCLPGTKATLLRDLGTMQFRAGDKNGASKSWGDALTLDSTLTLNPNYDASDVGTSWEDARASAGLPAGTISTKPPPSASGAGGAGGAAGAAGGTTAAGGAGHPGPTGAAGAGGAPAKPPEPTGEQPSGDFEHDPAPEQKEDTPLPIHVEYAGNSKLERVVLKYKGAQMREWTRLELKHVEGNGYEGVIPCADVTRGTMRYWVQAFDNTGEPVAATGDPKHPYYVIIRDKITSEPPHLPGKEAPHSCEETDCPPGLPGCKRKKGEGGPAEAGGAGEAAAGAGAGGDEGEVSEKKKGQGPKYSRVWFGLSFAVDFLSLSPVSNVCKRDGSGNAVNSQGYYCYDAGNDFPATVGGNLALRVPGSGSTVGSLQVGDVRLLLAFDYALSPNLLAGARAGYVFNAYPGTRAVHFPPVHIEARATYLLGDAPLMRGGFAPMGFAGLGLSEFDGHQSTLVSFNQVGMAQRTVDVWGTDAPFFIVLGAGARMQFARAAITAALRLNLVIGGNGLLPTFGPEIGVLYGF